MTNIGPSFTLRNPDELRAALPDRIAPDAPTPLWRALDEAMDAFRAEGDERRVILVLSDGKDSGPVGFRQRFVSQAEVIDPAPPR
jgi:Mg-chelatase subunit ChlD